MPTTHVTLDRFITLFVNHRPVYGIGKNNIEEAFKDLCDTRDGSGVEKISRNDFTSMLFSGPEEMNVKELEQALLQLIGEQNIQIALPQDVTADAFAEQILGFEEVDEAELQQEMDQQSFQQSTQ